MSLNPLSCVQASQRSHIVVAPCVIGIQPRRERLLHQQRVRDIGPAEAREDVVEVRRADEAGREVHAARFDVGDERVDGGGAVRSSSRSKCSASTYAVCVFTVSSPSAIDESLRQRAADVVEQLVVLRRVVASPSTRAIFAISVAQCA